MTSEPRRLMVALINWHHEEETGTCLDRLQSLRSKDRKILLVDNESTDDSAAWCKSRRRQLDYLVFERRNTGFAGACNIALDWARDEGIGRILFLNADAELEAETIPRLMAAMDAHPDAAAVSPILCDEDSRRPYFCGLKPRLSECRIDHLDLAAATALGEGRHGLALHGTVLMGDVAKLWAVGGFDTRLFAYWEDTDLSLRLIGRGYDCRIVTDARAYHQSGRSGEAGTRRSAYFYYYMARNEVRFWLRHGRGLARFKALYWHLVRARALARSLEEAGHGPEAATVRLGLRHGFLGIGGRWKRRTPA